jgi:hypothetical protein
MTKLLEIAKQCGAKTRDEVQFIGESSIIFGTEDQLRAFMNTANSDKGEAVATVSNKFGDPVAFAERGLTIDDKVLQSLPIGTKLFTAPQQAIPAGWVDENAAWIDSNNEKSEDGVYTAGISTPYHGHVIQCHADSEDEANELCKIVFDALSAAPTAPIDGVNDGE